MSEKQNRPSKSIFGSILRATPCILYDIYVSDITRYAVSVQIIA